MNNIEPGTNIGFIGLGNMGYPMAKRLAEAGYKLHVADLNAELVKTFCAETGSSPTENLPALGANSELVITMLPEGKAVRAVLMGANGVVSGLRPEAILVDMSSSAPVGTRELGNELAGMGFPLIDAPVSGGIHKAAEGTLAIMAGGANAAVDSCHAMLSFLGSVFTTGESGTGHAMKAMNNFLSAGSLALAAEAMIVGSKFGLDPKVMTDILNSSTGRSNSTEHKMPNFVLPRTFDSGFFLGLMAKDLRFASDLADAMETPSELVHAISDMWNKAEDQLGFNADNTEVVKYLESLSPSEEGNS